MAKSKKTFSPGDLVRYTANFMRSTGQYASRRIDGVVVGSSPSMGTDYVYVSWNDHMFPTLVNAANLEKKSSSMSPEALINHVRAMNEGLPIRKIPAAEDDKYRIYTPHRGRWDMFTWRDSYGEAEVTAVSLHDNDGFSVVVLAPHTGDVIFAMESDRQSNPGPHRRGPMDPRQSNAYDLHGSPMGLGVKILSRHPSYDAAVKSARKKSKDLGHAVYVDALSRSTVDSRGMTQPAHHDKPWIVWTSGEVGGPSPESLFGGRYMETLVEGHLKKNPDQDTCESNPKKYPYVVDRRNSGRWYVSRRGMGGTVTSAHGYDTAEEAEESARYLAYTRGERDPVVEREENPSARSSEPVQPSANRATIIAARLARGES